jgi:toxin CcdB
MAQFDVLASPRASRYPLVVDVQADVHANLATRLVIPLVARARNAERVPARLTIVTVLGQDYVVLVPMMAAVAKALLGASVGSLAAERATLIAAHDLMITGS